MIPAAPRAMRSRPADICRAALYSVPGICRCARCAPAIETPDTAKGLAPSDPPSGHTAAAPTLGPSPTGGGIFGEPS